MQSLIICLANDALENDTLVENADAYFLTLQLQCGWCNL